MENFNYKDYCIGLALGISFPQKFSIEDKLGEISDYFIGKCSFDKRQKLETPSGIMLQLNKDLMGLVIERNSFLGSYLFFYGDQIKGQLFPEQENNSPKVNLYGNPFVYKNSYEQTKNDFKNVYNLLFRYFKNIANIEKIVRIGLVHYFMIFYEDINFRYTESLKMGADLPIGENHNKLARNQYSYDRTASSWKNANIEYKINKKENSPKYSKSFGILSLDMQTYYEPEAILMSKLGGEEKIIDGLFNQAYEFIDKSKLFDIQGE